jgi:hypothetical protein
MRALILADIAELHWYRGSGHADLILAIGDTADSLILEAANAYGAPRIFAVKGNHGFAAFDTYIAQRQPRWFIHGHQHLNRETVTGATNVIGVYGYALIELS